MKKLALVIVVVAVALVFSRSDSRIAVIAPAVAPSRTPVPHAAISAPAAPSLDVAGARVEPAALVDRETTLVAAGRRAWRIAELAPELGREMHVRTSEGGDYVVSTTDAILARRDDGTIYVGWMMPGTGALADLERPGERIENAIAIMPTTPAARLAPAAVAVVVGSTQVRTVTAQTFAAAAKVTFKDKHHAATPAIALDHLVSFESNGERVTAAPPAPGARAVVYMNRRERFKLAWLDASGTPIGDKRGEVTQVTLAR
jgi:hypothetical protein